MLVWVMHCGILGAKPLPESMLTCCQLDPKEHISMKFCFKFKSFQENAAKWWPYCFGLNVLTPCRYCQHSMAFCCHMASWKWVIIGSGNDLLSVQCQAITRINGDWYHLGVWELTSMNLYQNIMTSSPDDAFEKVIWKMSVILSLPHHGNDMRTFRWLNARLQYLQC